MAHQIDLALHSRSSPTGFAWAGRFAQVIPDPISRLRFLRTVGRLTGVEREARPRRARSARLIAAVLAALIPGMLVLIHATTKPDWHRAAVAPPGLAVRPSPTDAPETREAPRDVWLVEKTDDSETYSNGLRINTRFAVAGKPRSYIVFPADGGRGGAMARDNPAGIVFHVTESAQAPFEARQNGTLKRIGESLLEYVGRKRAYHFVIDRFGRVYRVVRESDAAHHAGYSVWADEKNLYLNLNESFLGVAFEARSGPRGGEPEINPAQVRAAADLTGMLRARYGIPPGNCVTHAQVSVNPSNMRVGYHTDWGSNFPYRDVGLPDNYARALPAMAVFGFVCDRGFLESSGDTLRMAVDRAEDDLRTRAARRGTASESFRRGLQRDYHEKLAAVRRYPGEVPP
jgi:hypothetical protein